MNKIIVTWILILFVNWAHANTNAENFYNQGVEKNQIGQLIEASVLLTEAIALNDQQHRYFHQRGLSFLGMGEVEQGIKDFKQAADLHSNELGVYLKLIEHYTNQSQYMLVLIITDQMIVNLPEQAAGAYYDKGKAYETMKKPQLAIKSYQASLNNLNDDQNDFKQVLLNKINTLKQQEKTP
jgi:tetratricopeptide (TPR) repeat protein